MGTVLWRNRKQIKIASSHSHFSGCEAEQEKKKNSLMAKINKQSTHYWSRLYGECALMSCSTSQLWWCLCSWGQSSATVQDCTLYRPAVGGLGCDPLTLLLHMQKQTCGFGFPRRASGDQEVVNSAFWLIVLLHPQRKKGPERMAAHSKWASSKLPPSETDVRSRKRFLSKLILYFPKSGLTLSEKVN